MAYDLWSGSFTPIMDENGDPATSWTLNWYLAGTSTPATVYSNNTGTALGTSVTLNSQGLPGNSGVQVPVWLDADVDYKLIVKNAAGVTKLTIDNVHGPSYDAAAAVDDSSPRDFIGGLAVTINGTDPNNDIDIATGAARDDNDTVTIEIDSALTKRLDASWAAGTNQGGLDTGVKANSTTYYVYVIRRASDGETDALFSLSASSPTLPSGWTTKRVIGSLVTDGSGNISSVAGYNIHRSATRSELEAGTATNVVPTVGGARYLPGVAKAHANCDGTGTPAIRSGGFGFSSITDMGTGLYRLNFTTQMSSTGYTVNYGRIGSGHGSAKRDMEVTAQTQNYVEIATGSLDAAASFVAEDAATFFVTVFGDI